MNADHFAHLLELHAADRLAAVAFYGASAPVPGMTHPKPLFLCHLVSPHYLYIYDYRTPTVDITPHSSLKAALDSLEPFLPQLTSMKLTFKTLYHQTISI